MAGPLFRGLPGLFALPAGIGDVATGLLAPFVAYAWYRGEPYARSAAIVCNLFGMADLVNAVVLATVTGAGAGMVFPLVLVPLMECRARFSSTPSLWTDQQSGSLFLRSNAQLEAVRAIGGSTRNEVSAGDLTLRKNWGEGLDEFENSDRISGRVSTCGSWRAARKPG